MNCFAGSIESKTEPGTVRRKQTTDYKEKIEAELTEICQEVLVSLLSWGNARVMDINESSSWAMEQTSCKLVMGRSAFKYLTFKFVTRRYPIWKYLPVYIRVF